jgi:hypothetical protein
MKLEEIHVLNKNTVFFVVRFRLRTTATRQVVVAVAETRIVRREANIIHFAKPVVNTVCCNWPHTTVNGRSPGDDAITTQKPISRWMKQSLSGRVF